MRNTLEVSNFYKFFPIDAAELAVKKLSLEARAAKHDLRGLVILAEEGCNGTVAGTFEAVRFFEQSLPILFGNSDWTFKRAYAIKEPFKNFRVKVREEIVTTKSAIDASHSKNHLSPEQWQKVLDTEDDLVLIDVRNVYETKLGMFQGAIDPKTENFTDFPAAIRNMDLPKDQKVLMYCTGGIRCEKAIVEMQQQGYENVYQLEGGILNYLEQFPHRSFEGECFVFDGRVAVDQNLNPTRRWALCPHCGQPGDKFIECGFCEKPAMICNECSAIANRLTCSHDCAYKFVHHPSRLVSNA
ncbi:MAG: rhodanese-like domain-containing protein [Bdellovibrionota bacterium]